MDDPFSMVFLPRQSSSAYQTIGVFLVSPSCSWKKLELNFKKSTFLTEFQPRFIKLNTTRSVFTSAKVYYCWSVPQQSPSQTSQETLNLVFICGESLSTCVLIHTSLKREASMNKSDSDICGRLPTDFEIDCVLFYFDDANKVLDDARMQRWLHRHLNNYPSPTKDSMFIGVVSVNQSKSDEQTRSNSQPSRQPSIDFFNVKCFYLHLYQLIRTLINFRLKTKLPLFHNQLTPVSSDCAINGRKQSLHEYESLNVTANDYSEYEKPTVPIKLNGFTLGSSDEDSNGRNQLHSLSLSTQSAQTYFASMRTQASQTDIGQPSGSSDNDVFTKSENEEETSKSQSLRIDPQRRLINQSAHFSDQHHRSLPRKDDMGRSRNLTVNRENYPWQMRSFDGDSGVLKKSQLSLRFGRSCETLDSRDENKRPLKFSSFKNVKTEWPLSNGATRNDDPGILSSNGSIQDEPTNQNEVSSPFNGNISKDPHPQKYMTSFEKQHLVPWQPSQDLPKKTNRPPRPPQMSKSRETVKNDLSQTQMTANFSDIASKSTLSDNTLEFSAEKSSCDSPRRKISMEHFRQPSIDEEFKISKPTDGTPSNELLKPSVKYPDPRERPLPEKPGDRWPAVYGQNGDPDIGRTRALPKWQNSRQGTVDQTQHIEPEVIVADPIEVQTGDQLGNSPPFENTESEPKQRKSFLSFARSKSPIALKQFFNNSKDPSKRHSSLSRSPLQVVPFDEFQYLDNKQVAQLKQRRHSEFPQVSSPRYIGEETVDNDVSPITKNGDLENSILPSDDTSKLDSPISAKSYNLNKRSGFEKENPAGKNRSRSESRASFLKSPFRRSGSRKEGEQRSMMSSREQEESETSSSEEEEEVEKIGRERKTSKSPFAASMTDTCLDPAMSKQLVTPLIGVPKSPKHSGEKRDHDKDEDTRKKRKTSATSKKSKNSSANKNKKKKDSTSKR